MPQERLIGESQVQVVLVESRDHKINMVTDRIITTLPARFRANGLPYLCEFELNEHAVMTNLKVYSVNGLQNQTKLPLDRLRSLALIEATQVIPCFEKLEGEALYKRIGQIYNNAPHGAKYSLVAEHFGLSLAWAGKHTAIGKERYPKFFSSCNKTKQTKRRNK